MQIKGVSKAPKRAGFDDYKDSGIIWFRLPSVLILAITLVVLASVEKEAYGENRNDLPVWGEHINRDANTHLRGDRVAGEPQGLQVSGTATHYCNSYTNCSYTGNAMGCGGVYSPEDPTIVAVGPSRYREWPCGTGLRVCNATDNGGRVDTQQSWLGKSESAMQEVRCIDGFRQDACPGCGHYLIDLSEAAFERVCGLLSRGVCEVTIEKIE